MPGYKDPPKDKQFQPGKSGNPDGKPKGTQSWSTVVREILDDDALMAKLYESSKKGKKSIAGIVDKPIFYDVLPKKNFASSIVIAMAIEANLGNEKAATWLRRTGFGDKLDITSGERTLKSVAIFDMRSGTPMQMVPVAPVPSPKPKRQRSKPAVRKVTKKPKTVKVATKQPVKVK